MLQVTLRESCKRVTPLWLHTVTAQVTARMASSKACLVAALCCLIMFTTFISRADAASCCMRYTKRRLSCAKVLGYNIQTINGSCDISSIIFHLPGRFVCADPSMKWAKNCMNSVDVKRRKIAEILEEKSSAQVSQ